MFMIDKRFQRYRIKQHIRLFIEHIKTKMSNQY